MWFLYHYLCLLFSLSLSVSLCLCLFLSFSLSVYVCVSSYVWFSIVMTASVCVCVCVGLTPPNSNETFGLTTVWKELTPGQGCGVEILITFILVFCVFASVDGRRADLNGSTPLSIGLAVAVCHLFAVSSHNNIIIDSLI